MWRGLGCRVSSGGAGAQEAQEDVKEDGDGGGRGVLSEGVFCVQGF